MNVVQIDIEEAIRRSGPPLVRPGFNAPALRDGEADALRIVQEYLAEQMRPPTRRELAAELDLVSPSGAQHRIDALVAKGYLARGGPGDRTIRLRRRIAMPDFDAIEAAGWEILRLPRIEL